MAKRIAHIAIVFFILLGFISVCIIVSGPDDAEKFYTEYLEVALTDRESSIVNYHHYEIPLAKEMALISADNKLHNYEIISSKQLNSQLWAFDVLMVTDIMPEGGVVTNFVGKIDGSYYVMTSVYQIPDSIKSGVDINAYTVPNAIDFSDIVPFTESKPNEK